MRVADKDAATDSSGLALEVHVCLAFDLGYGVLVVDMCAELGREWGSGAIWPRLEIRRLSNR